jgi:hypothetical protein
MLTIVVLLRLHLAEGAPPTTCLSDAGRKLAAIKCLGTPFSAGVRFRNTTAAASCFRYTFKNSGVYRAVQSYVSAPSSNE